MTHKLDCVVVGAGVVGLAVARSLALAGREVIVLEAESQIGMHASSRNSEVVHAGIYYREGSLKARLCVTGKEMLYRYCEEHRIDHQRIGKLIVASGDKGQRKLRAIADQAEKNAVTDLRLLDVSEVAGLEPNVECEKGLLSPSTGIVDSHGLMTALQAEVEGQGGEVVLNSPVKNLRANDGELQFEIAGEVFACRTLVNSAGLGAQDLVLRMFGEGGGDRAHGALQQHSDQAAALPPLYFAKGHYFSYQGKSPFQRLIYPLPFNGGLGIHATNDLSGATRFGPDVTWVEDIDYEFDDSRKAVFANAIRSYFPGLDADKLVPAYTGIRPKLTGAGGPVTDFVIQGKAGHGVPGLVNLFGIESPGLTASLAIGEYVRAMLS